MNKLKSILKRVFTCIINSDYIEKMIYFIHNSKSIWISGSVVVDIVAFVTAIILQYSLPGTFLFILFYSIAIIIFSSFLVFLLILYIFNVKRSYLILMRRNLNENLIDFRKEQVDRKLTKLKYIGDKADLEKIEREFDIQFFDKNIRYKLVSKEMNSDKEEIVLQSLDEKQSENFLKLQLSKEGFRAKDNSVWDKEGLVNTESIISDIENNSKVLIEGEMGTGKSVVCQIILSKLIEQRIFKINISDGLPFLINLSEHFALDEENMIKSILPIKVEKLREEFAAKFVSMNNKYIFDGYDEYYNRDVLANNTAHPFVLYQNKIGRGLIITGRGHPLKEFRDIVKEKQKEDQELETHSYLLLNEFSEEEIENFINLVFMDKYSDKSNNNDIQIQSGRFLQKLKEKFPISYNIPIITFILTRNIEKIDSKKYENVLKSYYEILFSWYFGNKNLITRSFTNLTYSKNIYKFHTIKEEMQLTFHQGEYYEIIPYFLFIYLSSIVYKTAYFQSINGWCSIEDFDRTLIATQERFALDFPFIDCDVYNKVIDEILREKNFIITKQIGKIHNSEHEMILVKPDKIRELSIMESIFDCVENKSSDEFYFYDLETDEKERLLEKIITERTSLFDIFVERLRRFNEKQLETLSETYAILSSINPIDYLKLNEINNESELLFIKILPPFTKIAILDLDIYDLNELNLEDLEEIEVLELHSNDRINLSIKNLPKLRNLKIYDCLIDNIELINLPILESINSFFYNPCEYCELDECTGDCFWLTEEGFIDLMDISSFRVTMNNIESIKLEGIPEIKEIIIKDNTKLKRIHLADLKNLTYLIIKDNIQLDQIHMISEEGNSINKMVIWNNPVLKSIENLSNFYNIGELFIHKFMFREDIIEKLKSCKNIKKLIIQTSIPDFI